ncbi:hypothetical protein [Streptomyces chrestomyceticus]|uniref:hypothetical protein n=1 Tax=Streptomyces chrestomyceticus TaxID=68185 RepID=UPI00340A8A1B
MKARAIPLTLRWHLLMWRGGSRLAVGPVRSYETGQPRTIGATLSVARLTIGIMSAVGHTLTCTGHWYRDFGRRLGCFSVGGWRVTSRAVPVSAGWMVRGAAGEEKRNGFSVTLASRTLYVLRLCTRAEQRARYSCQPIRKR